MYKMSISGAISCDSTIDIITNIVNDSFFDYVVLEWDRDQPDNIVTQLEIVNNGNSLYSIKLHRIGDNYEKNVSITRVLDYIIQYSPSVKYIQAEFMNNQRDAIFMNL